GRIVFRRRPTSRRSRGGENMRTEGEIPPIGFEALRASSRPGELQPLHPAVGDRVRGLLPRKARPGRRLDARMLRRPRRASHVLDSAGRGPYLWWNHPADRDVRPRSPPTDSRRAMILTGPEIQARLGTDIVIDPFD